MLAGQVTDMSKTIWNIYSIAIVVLMALTLAALVYVFVNGHLTSRGFAIGCLSIISAACLAWYVLFLKFPVRSDSHGKIIVKTDRNSRPQRPIFIAILLLWICLSLWLTRHGPWIPRLIGVSVLVLFAMGIEASYDKQRPK